jgi:hypothetical protein
MSTQNPQTFLDRDNWMRAVLAAELPHAAVRLAIRIALHLRVNTGQCDPSCATLAAESHVPERSIYRCIVLLERAGWLKVGRAIGRGNQYTLLTPVTDDRGDADDTTATVMAGDPCQNEHPTPDTVTGDLAIQSQAPDRSAKKKRTSGGGETSPNPTPSARGQKGRDRARDCAQAFDRFWAVYPRRVAKETARKAFAAAIKRGADAEALIAGAQRYAVDRKSQDHKYTKHPSTWLNGGCWDDELPGTVIDQEGNVVAVAQPSPRRSRSFTEIADELNEDIERGIAAGTHDAKGWPIWKR